MTLVYTAGFQVTAGDPASMGCSVSGTPTTIDAGFYMMGLPTSSASSYYLTTGHADVPGQVYSEFGAEVSAKMSAALGAAVTAAFSETAGTWTVSSAGTFSITFTGDAGGRLRRALGFSGNKSGANSYTSDQTPWFVMIPSISARTSVDGPAEPDDVAEESVSDGGQAFVVAKRSAEWQMSWVQSHEPKAAVYAWARSSANEDPSDLWTWEGFFRHVRGQHPFFVWNDAPVEFGLASLHQLTARGASFRPSRVTADFDDHWTVRFETRLLGVVPP